mmetsp:Transcript_13927/g.25613  ORF Transcript_13927/g.25613 Transcript_13927/m.25613 type:complete len:221 (+) Transcript_13927:2-664(+)
MKASDFPKGCVLNPDRDMFAFQENHKKVVRQGNVKCGFCGKQFKNHHYADKHMDNKHGDQLQANATSCLADYCDVLGCDTAMPSAAITPCRKEEMIRRKHRCRSVFDQCFPAAVDPLLHNRYTHSFCDQLSCEKSGNRFPRITSDHNGIDEINGGRMSSSRLVVLILLFVGVVIFYGFMGHLQHGSSTRRDLRPLASRKSRVLAFFSSLLLNEKKKRLAD